jgi:hypothetical protein
MGLAQGLIDLYSDGMTTDTLQVQARNAIGFAEFREAWPIEVRRILVKAVKTEGEFPGYAVKEVRWALKEAQRVERKCAKDIEAGERVLTHAEKRARARSANRQHISPAAS